MMLDAILSGIPEERIRQTERDLADFMLAHIVQTPEDNDYMEINLLVIYTLAGDYVRRARKFEQENDVAASIFLDLLAAIIAEAAMAGNETANMEQSVKDLLKNAGIA